MGKNYDVASSVSLGSITFLTGLLGSSHPPCLSPSFYPTSPPHLTTPYSPTPTQLIASPPLAFLFKCRSDIPYLFENPRMVFMPAGFKSSPPSVAVRPMVIQLLPDAPVSCPITVLVGEIQRVIPFFSLSLILFLLFVLVRVLFSLLGMPFP